MTWIDWQLRRLARGADQILVGPWRSELGFETLYFLPWLSYWRKTYQIPKDRLVVVSRGGAGVWYDAGQVVELYDHAPVETIRKMLLRDAADRQSVKQQVVTAWETKLLATIAEAVGIQRYRVLHPSLMYRQLAPWWDGLAPGVGLLKQLMFTSLPVPALPLNLPLPERYVAVRFYARHTWPMTEEWRGWVTSYVAALAKQIPVVLLESGLHADEHVDFPLAGDNTLSLKDFVTPQNNLGLHSAVIAKAQAFVGTYGGTMQLAVRLRKPAIGFYEKFEGTMYAHKALTEWLAVQQGVPCFIGRPGDARFVKDVVLW